MKTQLISLLSLLLLTGSLMAQPLRHDLPITGLELQTNFAEAKVLSKESGKSILLLFSGSDWCKSCIVLKKKVLETPTFARYSQENLIVVNLDFPYRKQNKLRPALKKQNEALADIYNPKGAFPMMVLLDENYQAKKRLTYSPKMNAHSLIQDLKAR